MAGLLDGIDLGDDDPCSGIEGEADVLVAVTRDAESC